MIIEGNGGPDQPGVRRLRIVAEFKLQSMNLLFLGDGKAKSHGQFRIVSVNRLRIAAQIHNGMARFKQQELVSRELLPRLLQQGQRLQDGALTRAVLPEN